MTSFNINSTYAEILATFKTRAEGKTFIITGPSKSGIGAQVAVSLASASPKLLILAGRNEEKVIPVMDEIAEKFPTVKAKFVNLDLLSNHSVREAIVQIKAITKNVDFLINNAGVMATRIFTLSKDGIESQFAANYLGHFLLTNLLIKAGTLASRSLVLNVGSLGYQLDDINLQDINFANGETYNGWKAYGQSKAAQLLGTRGLANRVKDSGIVVLVAHPGITVESQLLANSAIDQEYFNEAFALAIERNDGQPLPTQNMVSIEQAAGVVIYAALEPKLRDTPGVFIVENEIYKDTREYANNDTDADKLWKLSEGLVGEEFAM